MKKYIFFISILFSLIIIPVVINNIKNYNQNLFSFKIKVINRIKNNTFQRCNIKKY